MVKAMLPLAPPQVVGLVTVLAINPIDVGVLTVFEVGSSAVQPFTTIVKLLYTPAGTFVSKNELLAIATVLGLPAPV